MDEKSEIARKEEKILEFWEKNKIFEKSLEKPAPRGEFVFYEGPPTANGRPGLHHLESRVFKDVIPRYRTMRGYHVRRKAGWDTHGLPVELEVEKQLGFKSKKDIERFGIAAFNQKCRENVWKYKKEWEKFTERIGFWLDQEHPYATYDPEYMEKIWTVIKKADTRGLLYKDYKVLPWCPRCGTALSSHELAQGYEDTKDPAVYVKFRISGGFPWSSGRFASEVLPSAKQTKLAQPDIQKSPANATYILAWTTTPWTLPGNVALTVGEDINYVKIRKEEVFLILARDRLSIIDGDYKIVEEMKGKDLLGLEYEPLFPYLADNLPANEKKKLKNAFKIYSADFVSTDEGSGIVHTAVMYGADDFVLGTKVGLPKKHLIDEEGKFLPEVKDFAGKFVKSADKDIIENLRVRGLLLKDEIITHTYPFCWRCKTPIIYFARDSWYIKMSALRNELLRENKKVNWIPEHIKNGRFGEWLTEVKDWAISRERFWGTPLPVWVCQKCDKKEVIGSLAELKEKSVKSGNRYFVMRHGQAENNTKDFHYKDLYLSASLTEKGKEQIKEGIKNFNERIDIFISSPLKRTRETTQIVCEHTKFPIENVIYNDQIREWETSSVFEGKPRSVFQQYFYQDYTHNPREVLADGESFAQVVKRVGQFIYEIELKYSNKNIFIVGHAGMAQALGFIVQGLYLDNLSQNIDKMIYLKNAQILELPFTPLPHNENYEPDLHRPMIDEVKLNCVCGGEMRRVKEVMDVWLDSGSMPFAQNSKSDLGLLLKSDFLYPADFIAEAIDQTRGWFYTLLAVATLMERGTPYRNVICLGLLLDAKGKKMSKSLGNILDPWLLMDKYGADTLRFWMYSVNQPGDPKNFDEKTVEEIKRNFTILENIVKFYELYADRSLVSENSKNILDKWIIARLNELISGSTGSLNNYKILEPARALKDFILDLSQWYVRRSRDRFKSDNKNDRFSALATTRFVLLELSKLLAPFTPFLAEDIYKRVGGKLESVHLENWPNMSKIPFDILNIFKKDKKVLENMEQVRKIVSLGLEARQREGIPVRQPLAKLEVWKDCKLNAEYIKLIKDELNVKEVVESQNIDENVLLWTTMTSELKREGDLRELTRAIQNLRKKEKLAPNDKITLIIETDNVGKALIQRFETDLKKAVSAPQIEFSENDNLLARTGEEIKIGDLKFKIQIKTNI